jgi:hypothetical protein
MRKKYKTIEEWRAKERERQKAWRAKNRGYEKLRAKNNYDKRRALVVETHYGGIEGVDVGYAEKELRERGGHGTIEREFTEDWGGAFGAARGDTVGGGVRRVSGADKGVRLRGNSFKPGDEGRGSGRGEADELGAGGAGSGGSRQEVRQGVPETANEEATYRRLEELKARKGRGGLNAGVEVELEL